MAPLLRALIVVLMLVMTGVVPAASGLIHDDDCTESHEGCPDSGCKDCPADCTVCVCCPLRGAPGGPAFGMSLTPVVRLSYFAAVSVRGPAGFETDIFHPPRA